LRKENRQSEEEGRGKSEKQYGTEEVHNLKGMEQEKDIEDPQREQRFKKKKGETATLTNQSNGRVHSECICLKKKLCGRRLRGREGARNKKLLFYHMRGVGGAGKA